MDSAVLLVTVGAMIVGAAIISFSLVYFLVSLFIKDTQEDIHELPW
jgi:ABC-type tungstate transport system substrate-binding protein